MTLWDESWPTKFVLGFPTPESRGLLLGSGVRLARWKHQKRGDDRLAAEKGVLANDRVEGARSFHGWVERSPFDITCRSRQAPSRLERPAADGRATGFDLETENSALRLTTEDQIPAIATLSP